MNSRLNYDLFVMCRCRPVARICEEAGGIGIIIIIEEKLKLL